MAERLHYRDRGGLMAVERFMKHYFLVAKDVGDLTRILCSSLEVKQLKGISPAQQPAAAADLERPRPAQRHHRFPHRKWPHRGEEPRRLQDTIRSI